jgi:LuxR family transcriptional regulator, maltose regulon positive regulatory protein
VTAVAPAPLRPAASLTLDLVEATVGPPPVRPGSVPRTSLVERLLATSNRPVVSIVAPAGYGKTTLLAHWAERDPRPFAWVSLRDPSVLSTYLAAELGRVGSFRGTGSGRQPPDHATWPTVVLGLRRALAATTRPTVLVLDDVQALEGKRAPEALRALAELVPEGSQIVLAGRTQAKGVPIPRLRAQGRVLEIGPSDLRLRARECAALVRAAGVRLPRARHAALAARTEGWPAGLYLTVLAIQSGDVAGDDESVLTGLDCNVADYLRLELLAGLSRADARFLTRTSVLERLSGPACDALLGRDDSARRLERLERAGLLLIPLDRNRESYRCHGLFRELLEAELRRREPALVAELHRRAAAWYEEEGDAEAGLAHADAAGESERSLRLIERLALPAYQTGRVATVEQWLARFDGKGELLDRHPAIAVLGAWVHAFRGHAAESARWAEAARRATAEEKAARGGEPVGAAIALLRAAMCRDGYEQMQADAELGLRQAAALNGWWPTALLLLGVSHLLSGDAERADRAFAEAAEAAAIVGAGDTGSAALSQRSLLAIACGDWGRAEDLAATARAAIRNGGLEHYASSALAHAATARLAVHQGERERASAALAEAARLLPQLTYAVPWLAVQVRLELVRAHLPLSGSAEARTLSREIGDVLACRQRLGGLVDQAAEVRLQIAAPSGGWASMLTTAELRLLPLLATHLSFREIAERLYVSRNTVKTQAISTYRKLGVSSRSDAIDEAANLGLIDVPAMPAVKARSIRPQLVSPAGLR